MYNIPNIELRSEEVQELMGNIPPAILRIGITFILFFVILIFVASNLIKYPDIISIPIVAKNVNYMTEIKVIKPGRLIDLNIEYGHTCKGDTLSKLTSNDSGIQDTISIISPISGIIYPCNTLHINDYVEENNILCIVVDSIKNKITAKAFISIEIKNKISTGTSLESNINNIPVKGIVTSIAKYAEPNKRTYSIAMEFEMPKELDNTIVWDYHLSAKIRLSKKSVFNKIVKNTFF